MNIESSIMAQLPLLIMEQVTHRHVDAVQPLGNGATSTAWQVSCGNDKFVVRVVPERANRPVTYRSEFAILRALRQFNDLVPEPIMWSGEASGFLTPPLVVPWAVTRQVAGRALMGSRMLPSVAQEIGLTLAQLHALPHQGYGRLREDSDTLQGQQNNTREGILARWCWSRLWPFDNWGLAQHPVTQLLPESVAKLDRLVPTILALGDAEQSAVLHSDLHGEHVFEAEGLLSGVIDFGAAFIGSPAWEFAILAHYHGWLATETALAAYTPQVTQRDRIMHETRLIAIVVALYKLAKIAHPSATNPKVIRIVDFVWETLRY